MKSTAETRIRTRHSAGKQGVNLLKRRYDTIAAFILKTVADRPGISWEALTEQAVATLTDFDGKIPWYVITVKLDLEARGQIERVKHKGAHGLRLVTAD